jgi:predicted RND superfamily exporter protein/nitrogen-specific signal transduction histidine kinase
MPRQSHFPKNFFQTQLDRITRHPWAVILLVGMVTLLLAWKLPRLSFQTTVYDLIIEDLPEAHYYQDFRALFGSDELIRLVIKADNIFDPATFAKVIQLSNDAGHIEGVRRILSLPEMKKSVDPGDKWTVDQFATLIGPVQLLERNLISADHRTTIITLVLSNEADKTAVIRAVQALIDSSGKSLSLYQTGMPLVSEALADYTQKDFLNLTPITLLVIGVLLLILFRNLQCVLLPLACVALSIIWTLGLMAWSRIPVSMLTIIVPVFLIAVGTAYCLHLCSDYVEQAQQENTGHPLTHVISHRVAFAVTLAVLTTMIGIGSLAVNHIPAIREFAFFTCFGMFSLLVIVLSFFPAVLALLPLPTPPVHGDRIINRWIDKLLGRVVVLNTRYQKATLGILAGVAAVCLVGVFFIRVETNPVSYFKPDTPVRRHFYDIYTNMSGSFPINVTVAAPTEDFFEDPAKLSLIADLQQELNQLPGVDKTVSLVDYLKLVNYVTNDYKAATYILPQDPYEMRYALNNFKMLLGSDLLQRFLSPDYSQISIMLLTHIASSRVFLDTRNTILKLAGARLGSSLQVRVTGLGMVIAASSHLLTTGQVKSLGVSLVLIFAVMVALFLSSKVGLIALLPNLFPILVNFGLMGLLGIPLSVATSLIASVAIGLAVDDTIHYLVRYNTEFKKDLDKDRAMRDTLVHVGRPIVSTSATIGLGFAVLMFSHFQPTAIFGFLMVVTMTAALAGDLLMLPALMMHVELVTAWDLLKTIPTVGRISAGMAHELNQPLNAIKVGSDFLKIVAKRGASINPEQLATVSQEISHQAARASSIIRRFSEAAPISESVSGPLQIADPIYETVGLLENQIKLDNILLTVDLAEPLPLINARHGRLVQAFYHLVQNGWEAIVRKKKLAPTAEDEHAITIRARNAEGWLLVTVADTGIGIAEHHTDRIFEPFFTTKAEGRGKGLGLSVVNQILRELGARINVDSQPGKGTTITISIPVAKPSA